MLQLFLDSLLNSAFYLFFADRLLLGVVDDQLRVVDGHLRVVDGHLRVVEGHLRVVGGHLWDASGRLHLNVVAHFHDIL